ncbi:MAG: FAD-dependent oxidoreductase [Bacteroidales bacterium]|nr:FAD-dependent oxidoreductase [Bacteroidales bacterium]
MAIVKKYSAEVVSIRQEIDGVFTVLLNSLGRKFKYHPGHFFHFSLDEYDPSMPWPESRCFSIQSSPVEDMLRFTYAIKGSYTTRMANELKVGQIVTLKLPYGDLFTQEHNKQNTVFIAGGTGITPFLSLFTHNDFAKYDKPILYSGFRSKEMNLYQKELYLATEINPTFFYNIIYQDQQGILDIEKIFKQSDSSSSFFMSGPPEMIKTFKSALIQKAVPVQHVLTDDWE